MGVLLGLIIKEVPGILDMIKARRAQVDPSLPALTDAEAIALLREAIDSSVARDDRWLAAHQP